MPQKLMKLILPFATLFSETVWDYAQILVMGAVLAPGKRTVSAALTVMGLKDDPQYQNYHRVLNRAKWCSLTASKLLLGLLVQILLAADVPLVVGADETLERRKGKQIKAKGVFRDAVRSSKSYVVHSYGLRWVSMMLIVSLPWSKRAWGLPFLTVNAPSPRTNEANGKRHKTSVDWVGQMTAQLRRWWPSRKVVLITDGGFSAVKLGLKCQRLAVTWVSRLRLDASLYAWPNKKRPPGKRGPKPKKGLPRPSLNQRLTDPKTRWKRVQIEWYGGRSYTIEYATSKALWYRPKFDPLAIRWVLVRDPAGKYEPTAFLCTDLKACPLQILHWFILRWNLEVTFQEARTHLGLETQRQWSDLAIARTTPALLGLFSLVTLWAYQLTIQKPFPVRQSAWYTKEEPTFSDALALVRRQIWFGLWGNYVQSASDPDYLLIPTFVFHGLVDSMCYTT